MRRNLEHRDLSGRLSSGEEFNAVAAKLEQDSSAAHAKTLAKDNLRAELMRAGEACTSMSRPISQKEITAFTVVDTAAYL
jgi:hypothetical protein